MTVDQAIGYLVRDPSSVEAEAARVLLHEITSRGQEVAAARAEVRRLREQKTADPVDVAIASVDEALTLELVERHCRWLAAQPGKRSVMSAMLLVLDAEVRRLRELLDAACLAVDASIITKTALSPEVESINAKLARVEALANRWRSFGIIGPRRSDIEETQRRMYADLAALLDRALREQP